MNHGYAEKLKELEAIRLRANEEIKRLSSDQSIMQSELNLMLLESQKYESQVVFLMSERNMIAKAQAENKDTLDDKAIEAMRKSA